MEKYDIQEDDKGTIRYYKPGTYILHRTDGPAVELADGSKSWHVNGKRHRTDGPAVDWADGTKEWYVDGELHRTDGPAVEDADGSKEWYVNGKQHRTDGPAVEYADGTKYWYINGVKMSEEQFNEKVSKAKGLTSPQNEWVEWADKQFNEKNL